MHGVIMKFRKMKVSSVWQQIGQKNSSM